MPKFDKIFFGFAVLVFLSALFMDFSCKMHKRWQKQDPVWYNEYFHPSNN